MDPVDLAFVCVTWYEIAIMYVAAYVYLTMKKFPSMNFKRNVNVISIRGNSNNTWTKRDG